ncbi:acyloxyacyl hydrolase [Poseidonocella sedimentorum]|uniref:Lipid A 3-O-deacylase (PagL) n=1 Tax=Poseidonocella sedimentorum TaxID=871652 RepID=A0A1I6DVJ0_9RHOB|nr:acyloxyacyl hydrolase [Poseidonocella sedimentorum]SFR09298.1 Lipid A 3-O-deacylase (PagL) [Poseidonocella sedimentorum]
MANGTMAGLLLLAGLMDMRANHCGADGGCLAKSPAEARMDLSYGEVVERRADRQSEIYMRYQLPQLRGPFGLAAGLSAAEDGEVWLGGGITYTSQFARDRGYFQMHLMPGLYAENTGFDLGGPLEFRSGIEIGYQTESGLRYGIGYDHRSNAGLFDQNPGIETVQIRIGFPIP